MNATKKKTAPNKLMPDKYLRFKDYILYTQPDNFVLSEVQVIQSGDNKGKEYATGHTYYSSLENAVQGMGNKIALAQFPELTKIAQEIKELRELVKTGLHI